MTLELLNVLLQQLLLSICLTVEAVESFAA
jgi:hypothetical protein